MIHRGDITKLNGAEIREQPKRLLVLAHAENCRAV